ncbi:MAG TPA: PfkB family carbohydrate kinase [Pyrinomonadaceae bacterium]|nr:PfkB family carbohydrate kinase [Pyrinomonadaceae bacterium]
MKRDDVTAEAEKLSALVRSFEGRRVLVLGDLVADQFLYGEIARVSREAPVLILRHERTETVPGGAANCVMNLATLGARASIVGAVGDDAAGRALLEKLEGAGVDCGGVVVSKDVRTTTKARVLAGHAHAPRQQVIRIDYEGTPADETLRSELAGRVRSAASAAEAFVVSDYNYGAAAGEALNVLREEAGSKPVLVDSRFRLLEFGGFTSATPNEDEVEQVAGRRLAGAAELENEGERLRHQLGYKSLLITRGKHGMLLIEDGAEPLHIEPVGSRDAVDVTGAGDTVIAAYALALASGAAFRDAAHVANRAGGLVVMKRGTACVTRRELLASLDGEDEP